jgi:hypothetical protein
MKALFAHHNNSTQENFCLNVLLKKNKDVEKIGFLGNKLFNNSVAVEIPDFIKNKEKGQWYHCDYLIYKYCAGLPESLDEEFIIFLEGDCCCDLELPKLDSSKIKWGRFGDYSNENAFGSWKKRILAKNFYGNNYICSPVNGVFGQIKYFKQCFKELEKNDFCKTMYCESRIGTLMTFFAGKPFIINESCFNSPYRHEAKCFGVAGQFTHPVKI